MPMWQNCTWQASEEVIAADEKSIGPFTRKSGERRIDLSRGAGVEQQNFLLRGRDPLPQALSTWPRQT